jgi:lipocalin
MKDNITALPVRPTKDDDFLHAALCMIGEGGDFAKSIGKAYVHADSHNNARLRAAFPDLFTQFYIKYQEHRS